MINIPINISDIKAKLSTDVIDYKIPLFEWKKLILQSILNLIN